MTPRPQDRIVVRDRPWLVQTVRPVNGHGTLVTLSALDGDEPRSLTIAVPPEAWLPLPPEALTLEPSALDALGAWTRAHRVLAATLVQETGLLSGARFGRVVLEPYQLVPALRLLGKPRPRLLIADDVGLGKTIEAGIALLELMARGRADRVLVITPPGLMEQWRTELWEKFGLRFQILGNDGDLIRLQTELPAGVRPWDALPRLITSVDYVKRPAVANRAFAKTWDLVIVDEAHALAVSGTPQNPYLTRRAQLGRRLIQGSRGLLLLTATPHNGYAHAFRSLLELVEPSRATLAGEDGAVIRRIGDLVVRRMKAQITRRAEDGTETPGFRPRHVTGVDVGPPPGTYRDLLARVASYCSRTAAQAVGTERELIGFAMQIVKKRALSSRRALEKTVETRLAALQREEEREAQPKPAELREYQAGLALTEAESERTARRILRSAIPADAKRRRQEIRALTEIQRLLHRAGGADPKLEALVEEVRAVLAAGPDEKLIVFTEYRDTLAAALDRLAREPALQGRIAVLTGGLSRRERLRREEQFAAPQARVLLATDAASEGLNLQRHCRRILHVELPWNPNRLEQRNGRVDRYGQERDPIIRYLYYGASAEEEVLHRLVGKIEQMRADGLSTPDILGALGGEGRVEEALTTLDPEAAPGAPAALADRLSDEARALTGELRLLVAATQDAGAGALLDPDPPPFTAEEELEATVLGLLPQGSVQPDPARPDVYRIAVPLPYRGEGVAPVYPAATFRRAVAARWPADEVEFLTPLHPFVRAVAASARRRLVQVYAGVRGLPPRRLAARTAPDGTEPSVLFTFLGEVTGGGGLREERLIAVRVGLDGRVLTDADPWRWLREDVAGSVPWPVLERLVRPRFEELREIAGREAQARLVQRAEELRAQRRAQAALLREDLERDVADRIQELDLEAALQRGGLGPQGQLSFFGLGSLESVEHRRHLVEAYRAQRLEDLAAYETVDEPPPPRPLGALVILPEGQAAEGVVP